MKKQKMKLNLKRFKVSNLQGVNAVKGGDASQLSANKPCVDMCMHSDIEEQCAETANCGTGGYICGGSARLNCQIPSNPGSPC